MFGRVFHIDIVEGVSIFGSTILWPLNDDMVRSKPRLSGRNIWPRNQSKINRLNYNKRVSEKV